MDAGLSIAVRFSLSVSIYVFLTDFADLKPENLLFRTGEEDADIMIADFGLSRVLEGDKFNLLTEICGTPGVSRCSSRRFSN
jgi:hypothetical protein